MPTASRTTDGEREGTARATGREASSGNRRRACSVMSLRGEGDECSDECVRQRAAAMRGQRSSCHQNRRAGGPGRRSSLQNSSCESPARKSRQSTDNRCASSHRSRGGSGSTHHFVSGRSRAAGHRRERAVRLAERRVAAGLRAVELSRRRPPRCAGRSPITIGRSPFASSRSSVYKTALLEMSRPERACSPARMRRRSLVALATTPIQDELLRNTPRGRLH